MLTGTRSVYLTKAILQDEHVFFSVHIFFLKLKINRIRINLPLARRLVALLVTFISTLR